MIIWTPLPLELVLDGLDAPPHKVAEIRHLGRILLVEPISATQARIVRVISSDPADYLDASIEPGRVIAMAPVLP